ncbi:MAG TPA: O-methyltransferase [Thermoanaerobaculia bacterium]
MKDRVDAILQRQQAVYLESLLPARDALLEQMEKLAAEDGHPIADPEVAQLMRALVRLKCPQRVLEIGTSIGYSVVVIGRECGEETVIETIEIDHDTLSTARAFVAEASLPCRVVFHEGAALDVLPRLTGPFDLVFIDCVKTEYLQYLDSILPKLAQGAVIVCDNLLWKGHVAADHHDPETDALRAFNLRITTDARLMTSILPLGDGTGISVVL